MASHFNGAIAAGNEADKLFIDAQRMGLETFELKHLKRNIDPLNDIMAVWEIRNLIKHYKPDIVHLNSTKAGILGSFAAIGLKTKVVFTAHGFRFNEPLSYPIKQFYLALEKTASSYRDFIITVSNADKNTALENNLITPNKIKTIHNGIGPINFLSRDEARQKLGIEVTDNKKIIGAIANDYATKGLDILETASHLMSPSGTLTFVIGLTPHGKETSSDGKFQRHGYEPNASLYLKAFDVFAIPSRKEGMPFGLLEAMQAGLPIVATNVGGIPEAIGNDGLLVEPENPRALAEASSNVINDEDLANQLSQKALERSKLFTEEKMLAETKKIYELILKK